MSERINRLYKPSELKKVLEVLEDDVDWSAMTPVSIIKDLLAAGYRIVYCGKIGE